MNWLVIIGLILVSSIFLFGCTDLYKEILGLNESSDNNSNNFLYWGNGFSPNLKVVDNNKETYVIDLNVVMVVGRDYNLVFYLDENMNWKEETESEYNMVNKLKINKSDCVTGNTFLPNGGFYYEGQQYEEMFFDRNNIFLGQGRGWYDCEKNCLRIYNKEEVKIYDSCEKLEEINDTLKVKPKKLEDLSKEELIERIKELEEGSAKTKGFLESPHKFGDVEK